jgi:hypothetical protein
VNKLSRLSVALGSGLALSVGALLPVATATAAPSTAPAVHARNLVENPVKDLIERGVTPSECATPPISTYVNNLVASMSVADRTFLFAHLDTLLDVPTYEPLFFGTAGDGVHDLTGHAQQLRQTFRDLKKFWAGSEHDGVQFDDIQLMAMHGDVLLDADRIAKTLTLLVQEGFYDLTAEEIATEAQTVATYMQSAGDFYNNPLWTLNAYAFTAEGDPDPLVQGLPDKLVFGDGILDFLDAAGLGDAGTRAVMGHEFGHHIQYEIGTFDDEPADASEATRRTELMADAFGAYFMVHKRGEAINKKRAVDTLLASFSVGDCNFTSPGHHGTPLQRERAASWGADLAMAAQPKSYVIDATVFEEMFDAALPKIITG